MGKWLTPGLAIGLLSGGLAGSVFTWYMNHPRPAVITYVISTTSTGADPAMKSLVPNLSLRIGDEPIRAIHTHAIELSVTNGYAESAPLAVLFDTPARMFGELAQAPTPLHKIQCDPIDKGLRCNLGPLDPRESGRYRILVATDSPRPPRLTTTGRDVQLSSLEQSSDKPWYNSSETFLMMFTVMVSVLTMWAVISTVRDMYKLRIEGPTDRKN